MKALIVALVVVIVYAAPQTTLKQPNVPKDGFTPKDGFVPTADVAETVAQAVLIPVYGKRTVESERPFKAALHGDIWIVNGKVPCEGPKDAVCPGGAGEVWISKRTGQVLYMTHLQ
jgi:NTF2 fold immunity protein